MRAGRLGPQGQGRVEVHGATLTNGPGCCPDACQEQQGPCSESCYLGSRTTWHSPATCNRDHAGATARPVLARVGSGYRASSVCPHMSEPTRPSWQGCLSPAARMAGCPAPQGLQLGRGVAGTAATLAACSPGVSPSQ